MMRAISFLALLVAAWLLNVSAGVCGEPDLAYEPTGDALYDRYAQALLDRFREFVSDPETNHKAVAVLPDEILSSWETEFGEDPRYWQLLYYNDFGTFDLETGEKVFDDFDYAKELAAETSADPVLAWIILEHELANRSMDEFSTEISEERIRLIEETSAAFPHEGYFMYLLAHEQFAASNWSGGMATLQKANSAPHNRRPLPFPLPFLIDRIVHEQHCGNKIAAGMAIGRYASYPQFDHKAMKRNLNDFLEEEGQDLSSDELSAWNLHLYRLGTLENGGAIEWIVARALLQRICHFMFVQQPHRFMESERQSQWDRLIKTMKIRDLARHQSEQTTDEMLDQIVEYDEGEEWLHSQWEAAEQPIEFRQFREQWLLDKFSLYFEFASIEYGPTIEAHRILSRMLETEPSSSEE